jgi:hypothetical protein
MSVAALGPIVQRATSLERDARFSNARPRSLVLAARSVATRLEMRGDPFDSRPRWRACSPSSRGSARSDQAPHRSGAADRCARSNRNAVGAVCPYSRRTAAVYL